MQQYLISVLVFQALKEMVQYFAYALGTGISFKFQTV